MPQTGRPSLHPLGLGNQRSVPLVGSCREENESHPDYGSRRHGRSGASAIPLSWPEVPRFPSVDTGPPCSICMDHHVNGEPWICTEWQPRETPTHICGQFHKTGQDDEKDNQQNLPRSPRNKPTISFMFVHNVLSIWNSCNKINHFKMNNWGKVGEG